MQVAEEMKRVPTPQSSRVGAMIREYWLSLTGLSILAILVLLALTAPILGLDNPTTQDLQMRLQEPSGDHLFGTDLYGRDLLSRVIYGSRSSLAVAFASVAMATVAGVMLGLVAGYLGGFYDNFIMRFTDVLMAFPSILLGIGLLAVFGPSLWSLVVVLAVVQIPTMTRMVRADTLTAKSNEFVEAAHAIGASHTRIVVRHVFPSVIPSIIVLGTLSLGQAVILESAFGFLGIGVQPPTPSWGNLLSDARAFLRVAPHTSIIPGMFIALLALSFNLIGDGLRDFLDPRQRTSFQRASM